VADFGAQEYVLGRASLGVPARVVGNAEGGKTRLAVSLGGNWRGARRAEVHVGSVQEELRQCALSLRTGGCHSLEAVDLHNVATVCADSVRELELVTRHAENGEGRCGVKSDRNACHLLGRDSEQIGADDCFAVPHQPHARQTLLVAPALVGPVGVNLKVHKVVLQLDGWPIHKFVSGCVSVVIHIWVSGRCGARDWEDHASSTALACHLNGGNLVIGEVGGLGKDARSDESVTVAPEA